MDLSYEYKRSLLTIVKQRLGILSDIRDDYIESRILAEIQSLLLEKGVILDENDMNLTMFIVDQTCWRYQNVGGVAMPIDLRMRLNNILMKYTGGDRE